jgi:hypothetical protein
MGKLVPKVVTDALADWLDRLPLASYAATVYEYVVDADKPVSLKLTVVAVPT